MKDYTKDIAEEIKNNREYLGWSQAKLGIEAGLSKYIIHQIENNRAPSVNEFIAIDRALDGNLYWKLTEL